MFVGSVFPCDQLTHGLLDVTGKSTAGILAGIEPRASVAQGLERWQARDPSRQLVIPNKGCFTGAFQHITVHEGYLRTTPPTLPPHAL